MTNTNARNAASVITALAVLVVFAFALSTARSKARQSSVARATGSSDAVTYFIADGKKSNGYRPGDRELALWALQSWERNAGRGLRFVPAGESAELLRLHSEEPAPDGYG